jgi:glucose-6-phosphate dehydrogenase assembly protein OpcA
MAASVVEIERDLAELRDASGAPGQGPVQRTSVMTHLAWVPQDWTEAAERTLAGLAEQHPSRTILLFPHPEEDDALDMDASVQCFAFGDQSVCAEVIRVRLCGGRVRHPASVVVPMLVADLPVFCRWRGVPGFDDVFEELVDVVDRLIVDSTEWPTETLAQSYAELAKRFDRTAVSDIAWERTERWRRVLAAAWPFEAREISVRSTYAQALLLAGWLRSRLGHDVAVEHEPADVLTSVYVDGKAIDAPVGEPPPPSDLLSGQLERFTRDPVYEAAVVAAGA